jgi:hypothetical protein
MSNQKKPFHNTERVKNILKSRKSYQKPHLEELGDLRTLTLGGSVGVGDTGGTGGYEAPMGGSPDGFLLPPDY